MSENMHTLSLDKREEMRVGGVMDVESFSEKLVVIKTTMGRLTVRGENLLIKELNVESGDMMITGRVNSMEYSKLKKQSGAIMDSLFR